MLNILVAMTFVPFYLGDDNIIYLQMIKKEDYDACSNVADFTTCPGLARPGATIEPLALDCGSG